MYYEIWTLIFAVVCASPGYLTVDNMYHGLTLCGKDTASANLQMMEI